MTKHLEKLRLDLEMSGSMIGEDRVLQYSHPTPRSKEKGLKSDRP